MGNQTTLLSTISMSEMTDLIEKKFVLQNQYVETGNATGLYIYSNESANTGDTRRFDEIDVESFGSLKKQGMDAVKAKVGIGYTRTITAKRIAKEIDITWEMRRYNKYPEVTGQLTALSSFCPNRIELDATHRFTFCTSSTYTDMDGETVTVTTGDSNPLAYATHDLLFSSTQYRNRVSGDPILSTGGLDAAKLLTTTDILSNFGDKRVMNFNTLITGDDPSTIKMARQILESTADVDAVQAGIKNTYTATYKHVILPYLATTATGANDSTKRRWWFIAATGNGASMSWQAYFGLWEAPNLKSPTPGSNLEDGHNDNWTYGCRASYGMAILSGKGFIASCPTS